MFFVILSEKNKKERRHVLWLYYNFSVAGIVKFNGPHDLNFAQFVQEQTD